MTLKDIPTYITYKSISTSHKLCSGLCQIVLVFRSLIDVHVHIYTQSTSIHVHIMQPWHEFWVDWFQLVPQFHYFLLSSFKQWYNKMSKKKRLRVDVNIFSIANLALFYVQTPPLSPIPQKYYVKSWINALMLSAEEHYSDSLCEHI